MMFLGLKAFFALYKLYFILAAVAVLVLGTGTVVWKYKSAVADRERIAAVAEANKEAQGKIDAANKLAEQYRDLADKKYGELIGKLSTLKVHRVEITNNIRQEVAANEVFYGQPLTPKGWDQWIKARNQYRSVTGTTK